MPSWRCRRVKAGKRVAILSGGELTVTVRGNGRGGPNQEYALALASLLKDHAGHFGPRRRYRRRRRRRRQRHRPGRRDYRSRDLCQNEIARPRPQTYLANNDASAFFDATGDLLLTGPTLTNVNDVRVILIDQK